MRLSTTAEIYFYKNVTKLFDDELCQPFEYGQETIFSWDLYVAVFFVWLMCFFCVMFGVNSSQYVVMFTVPMKLICLICLIIHFTGLNKKAEGKGLAYYLGGERFPQGTLADGEIDYYDPKNVRGEIIMDSYVMVLYSVGLGVGVFFSYGSYNHIK